MHYSSSRSNFFNCATSTHSSTYMTTPTTVMSCTPLTTSTVTPNMIPIDQYNSLMTRLNNEVQHRTRVENELTSAQSQIAFLKSKIASLQATLHSSNSTNPTPQPITTNMTTPSSRNGNEKEILSHCSDISAHKAAVAAQQQQHHNHHHRQNEVSKTKTPSTSTAGITKKKSKKERNTKAKIPGQSRYWTPEEHKLFLEALTKFGHKDLRSISTFVGTRNMTQVRTHSQKYFMRLMREAKRQNPAAKAASTTEDSSSVEVLPKVNIQVDKQVEKQVKETEKETEKENDKYSVPNTCGMTLLCLVGQDTLPM